jgi:fructokinase
MGTSGLIDRVQELAERLGAGYFTSSAKEIVALPGLGDRSGLLGALALAIRASADS